MSTRYSEKTGGFYPLEIDYGDSLPDDVKDVSDDLHFALLAAQSLGHVISADNEGNPIAVDPGALMTLADLKKSKLAELSAAFAQRMEAVKDGYPADEIQSWFDQKGEAVAFTASPAAATPLLFAMASARGITVADLAARVIANAAGYAAAAGLFIGKRQKYEDAVNAAADPAAVTAVTWID